MSTGADELEAEEVSTRAVLWGGGRVQKAASAASTMACAMKEHDAIQAE
jgi:hypothetical protein